MGTVKLSQQTWRKLRENLGKGGLSTPLRNSQLSANEILVYNNSGYDISRYGILAIEGVKILPDTQGLSEFQRRPVLSGILPNWAGQSDGKFVICLEPIKNGAIGVAAIDGITVAPVYINVESDTYADIFGSGMQMLTSCTSGTCQILYKEAGAGNIKWAIVRFGGTGGAGVTWISLTNVTTHPMIGTVQRFVVSSNTWQGVASGVQVFRYPTYTDNTLYLVGNIIAASPVGGGKYVALDTLPCQIQTEETTTLF